MEVKIVGEVERKLMVMGEAGRERGRRRYEDRCKCRGRGEDRV